MTLAVDEVIVVVLSKFMPPPANPLFRLERTPDPSLVERVFPPAALNVLALIASELKTTESPDPPKSKFVGAPSGSTVVVLNLLIINLAHKD